MGALLVQEIDNIEQVISTFSRKFNEAQLKYTVGKQELLAAHEACRFFHDIIVWMQIEEQESGERQTKILNWAS